MILYCGISPLERYPGAYAVDVEAIAELLVEQSCEIALWNCQLDMDRIPELLPGVPVILVCGNKTPPPYEFAAAHGYMVSGREQQELEQTLAALQQRLRLERQNGSYRSFFAKYGGHLQIHLWHDLIVEGQYSELMEPGAYRLLLLEPEAEAAPKQLVEEPQTLDSRSIIAEIFPEAVSILALQAQWEGVVFSGPVSRLEERAEQCKKALAAQIGETRRVWISPALYPAEFHDFYMETLSEAVRRDKGGKTVAQLICSYVDSHLDEKLTRKTISDNLFFSPDYLAKVFQEEMGITLGSYICNTRLARAKEQLEMTDRPVGTIASALGYQNFSEFSQWFKKLVGQTPSQYRKQSRTAGR